MKLFKSENTVWTGTTLITDAKATQAKDYVLNRTTPFGFWSRLWPYNFSLLLLEVYKINTSDSFVKTDFVHTRLTHSLEVSVVGRSLGRLVEKNYWEIPALKKRSVFTWMILEPWSLQLTSARYWESSLLDILVRKQLDIFLLKRETIQRPIVQERMAFDWFWRECQWFSVLLPAVPNWRRGLRISMPLLVLLWNYPKESLPKKPTKT
jgi:hypothetical protein